MNTCSIGFSPLLEIRAINTEVSYFEDRLVMTGIEDSESFAYCGQKASQDS